MVCRLSIGEDDYAGIRFEPVVLAFYLSCEMSCTAITMLTSLLRQQRACVRQSEMYGL